MKRAAFSWRPPKNHLKELRELSQKMSEKGLDLSVNQLVTIAVKEFLMKEEKKVIL